MSGVLWHFSHTQEPVNTQNTEIPLEEQNALVLSCLVCRVCLDQTWQDGEQS